MNKINIYLSKLTFNYIFINFNIISILILIINSIELSRILTEEQKNLTNFIYLSMLKFPSILNEILPFVTIISIAFLIRSLVNNNELISMRNLGYSILDIFKPIALSIFSIGIFFLFLLNPISVFLESKYDKELNNNDNNLYSIKISNNQMWIKNKIDESNYIFINIKNIDLKDMNAEKIKILLINKKSNKFISADKGKFNNNLFTLENVIFYNFQNERYNNLEYYDLKLNFSKENILNSIAKYKLIPFYYYFSHSKTLQKFNLYSSEIGLFYLSEVFKPVFLVVLSFVILGFTGKFQRNENFFKVLLLSIAIGFIIFLYKEVIIKLTLALSINFIFSYLLIFIIPLLIGLYQVIKIEND